MQGIPDMNREIQVNVADFNSGIYLVQVTGNTINQQVKIIKK
jgi:urease gamma subunit